MRVTHARQNPLIAALQGSRNHWRIVAVLDDAGRLSGRVLVHVPRTAVWDGGIGRWDSFPHPAPEEVITTLRQLHQTFLAEWAGIGGTA